VVADEVAHKWVYYLNQATSSTNPHPKWVRKELDVYHLRTELANGGHNISGSYQKSG